MYHYDPATALEELKEEALLPNPVHVRDMMLRAKLDASAATELNRKFTEYQKLFGEAQSLVRDILQAAPSVWPYIESINNHILTGEMYKALKHAKKLIAYEQELLNHAKRGAGLPCGSERDRQPA